jgi:AcrR family transcriptional regulator
MGIRERRERERLELRADILAAARRIALHEGWNAVSIRKIADVIEYSPPTIYEHFVNKEAILLALMVEGVTQLIADLRHAQDSVPDPEAALLAMARAYLHFAWQNPELYQVMHAQGGVPYCEGDDYPAEFDEVFEVTAIPLQQLGVHDPQAIADTADTIWALLHGIVSLHMSELIEGGQDRSLRLAEQAMRNLMRGLSSVSV